MTFPILGGNGAVGSYSIDNSLRFNSGDSPQLSRTPDAGNRRTFTLSFWVKRGKISVSSSPTIISSGIDSSNDTRFLITDQDIFLVRGMESGSSVMNLQSSAKFRDASAWYHFVMAVDTTQSTASDRVKIYVNGVQNTSFGTEDYPTQNRDLFFNHSSSTEKIGVLSYSNANYWDGYMAEFQSVDGQQLTPTSFGEFDEDSGIWKPKQYTGSYGTNGFYLDFENSGSSGTDQSGNGNNFTPTNLASTDQTTDTPTNNFATLTIMYNPINTTGGTSFSEGNLKFTTGTGSARDMDKTAISNIPVNSGKWYCEVKLGSEGQERIGAGPHQGMIINGGNNNRYAYIENDGDRLVQDGTGEVNTAYMANPSNGDIMMLALDMDNKRLYAGTNGLWSNGSGSTNQSSPNAYLDLNTGTMLTNDTDLSGFAVFQFLSHDASTNQSYEVNFGNPSFSISSGNTDDNGYGNFEYAPPTGYLSLCTQNLSSTSPTTIDDPSAYFTTTLYTGNGSDDRSITNSANAGNFKPDWLWVKQRNTTRHHILNDSNRGATKNISTSLSNAESTGADAIQAFETNGFQLGTDADVNQNSGTYVAWQWKANGGTTSSNTNGSITSTVQANTTAGFSIVTYTGTGSNATVGHGLGVKPDVVIVKGRSSTENWGVQMANTLGFTNALRLNLSDAYGGSNGAGWWNDTAPTTTTVSIGTRTEVNTSGNNYLMYCFNNVEGYSKYGKYTGNGNTDGAFVYTGFRPALVICKKTSGAENWNMTDSTRSPFNVCQAGLSPSTSSAEDTTSGTAIDLLSNGFKARATAGQYNDSGASYIYMAWAESPFVDSNGVPITAR